ncbi:hypothetical protein, partial [Brevundimonas sp.]|uniref:hypothetical protein n=1 Tax=Brevundimonas sp. TaxID=1871086 RepID=UPI002AB9617C
MTALSTVLPIIAAFFSLLAMVFAWMAWSATKGGGAAAAAMDRLPDLLRGEMASFRQGADQLASTQRLELNSVLKGMADSLNARIAA